MYSYFYKFSKYLIEHHPLPKEKRTHQLLYLKRLQIKSMYDLLIIENDEIKPQMQQCLTKLKNNNFENEKKDKSEKLLSSLTTLNKDNSLYNFKSDDSNAYGIFYVPKTHRKSESTVKEAQIKINNHNRNYSFDKIIKPSNYISNNVPTNTIINPKQAKKIYEMKKNQTKSTLSNNTKLIPSPNMHSGKISTAHLTQINSSHNTSSVQVPLINHMNICASNINKFKINDINVRQYIFNKINNNQKLNPKHMRSNSITNQ